MKSYLKTKDYSVTGEEFELLYDEELKMLVTNPKPKNLEKYYESENYISHSDSKSSYFDFIYQTVKKYSIWKKIRFIQKCHHNIEAVLDIGAGTGEFLLACQNKGWSCSGIEPNHDARMKAQEKGVNLNAELESVVNDRFDIITLWHVLEHLPELEIQIEKIASMLNEDGTLLIAVPNFNSYDAKHYKKHWAAFDVPRHLWHFSKESIQIHFAKQGMKVVKTRPMVFDSFYVSILSEQYKKSRFGFFKGFLIGIMSNLKALSSKESSSVLYVLKKS